MKKVLNFLMALTFIVTLISPSMDVYASTGDTIEREMTYEEYAEELAALKGITIDEVKTELENTRLNHKGMRCVDYYNYIESIKTHDYGNGTTAETSIRYRRYSCGSYAQIESIDWAILYPNSGPHTLINNAESNNGASFPTIDYTHTWNATSEVKTTIMAKAGYEAAGFSVSGQVGIYYYLRKTKTIHHQVKLYQ